MSVNVFGVFNVLRQAARRLRAAGKPGAIVNSASMAGVEGAANMPAYSASKGAVMSITRSASKDFAPLGIRVDAISPCFIGEGEMRDRQVRRQALADTQYYSTDPAIVAREMVDAVPLRRTGTLDEVASTVLWLLSDRGLVYQRAQHHHQRRHLGPPCLDHLLSSSCRVVRPPLEVCHPAVPPPPASERTCR